MDDFLSKVKSLLGGVQQPQFLNQIGSAISSGLNTVANTNFMPNQKMPISQAFNKASQNLSTDFGNVLRGTNGIMGQPLKNPIIPNIPVVSNLSKLAANTGQTIASGMGDIGRGAYNVGSGIKNKNVLQVGQGVVNTAMGAGKIVAPTTPFFQAGNVLSQSGGNLTQRIGKGMIQGQTRIDKLAPNVQEQKINLLGMNIDPIVGAASLAGFTQNPTWMKIFGQTTKLAQFGLKGIALKGGFEGLIQGLDQLPNKPSDQDIQKTLLTNIAFGMGAEVGTKVVGDMFKKINGSQLVQSIKEDLSSRFASDTVNTAFGPMPKWKVMIQQALGKDMYTNPSLIGRAENSIELPNEDVQGFRKVLKLAPEGNTQLTPEQIAANKKLPGILFSTSEAKANGKGNPDSFLKGLEEDMNRPPLPPEEYFSAPPPKKNEVPSDEFIRQMDNMNVKNKVNIIDYLRTPQKVLDKLGLGYEGKALSTGWDNYKKDLSTEINKITAWQQQVPSPESAVKLFRYLDGKSVDLSPQELKVANEIKPYLAEWADKLGLDPEKRISNYITHIFEKGMIEKEFDPEVAKIIADKVPGSVYDPFTQQRLGKMGYVENVWKALDAYVKRGTRKVNMDPALEQLSSASQKLDLESWNYVKQYADRINLRPTEVDNLVDNFIKSTPIRYKLGQRPTAALTQSTRQMVYRGTLGLNVGSALRNLTQGVNTYAELGEKYTFKGYMDLMRNGTKELVDNGVLDDGMVQDRTVNVLKNVTEKMDKGLFYFFETAEKINRGSAYFGAKAKALAQGMKEPQAIEYAKNIVSKTQFKFGSIDTPLALSSDIAKTLGQFQSFNLKQAEFLGEKIASKDIAGLVRYSLGTLLMINTIGKVLGMNWKDAIPFSGVATGDTKLGQTPPIKLGMDVVSAITGGKDMYGQDQSLKDRLDTFTKDAVPFIPAGVQIKKTIEGLDTVRKGLSTNASGNVQFPVKQSTSNMIRGGLFGKSNLTEAQNFYNSGAKALSETQSSFLKSAGDKFSEYAKIIDKRKETAQINDAKDQMTQSGNNVMNVGTKVLIRQPNGDIKTIDTAFTPQEPQLTGNTELDKKLISKYKGQITSKSSDILELFQAGKITADDAEKQINALKTLAGKYATAKKPKKITMKIRKAPKAKVLKLKMPKIAKVKGVKLAKLPKQKSIRLNIKTA